jgi:hypothetical protein
MRYTPSPLADWVSNLTHTAISNDGLFGPPVTSGIAFYVFLLPFPCTFLFNPVLLVIFPVCVCVIYVKVMITFYIISALVLWFTLFILMYKI